jgi:iron complex outermembrane receptor protein
LRLNAAIFQNEITGMVIEALGEDPQGGPLQDFLNAGDATVNGIEIDLMWMLSDSLVINVGAGFLDPEYDKVTANLDGSDDDGDGFPDTFGGQSDKALEIKYMHEETYTLGFAYDMTIAGGSLSARANYNYRSEAMYKDDNSAMFPAYEQVNAGLTYRPNDGNWSLNLFAKNITDKTVVGAVNTLGSRIMSPMKKGRRFGLEFNYEI